MKGLFDEIGCGPNGEFTALECKIGGKNPVRELIEFLKSLCRLVEQETRLVVPSESLRLTGGGGLERADVAGDFLRYLVFGDFELVMLLHVHPELDAVFEVTAKQRRSFTISAMRVTGT